jgi:DNA-binding YbaB/EbfC family protein
MFDMMKMMGKMKEVQSKIKEAQDNLVHIKATSDAGGGMVSATVNGKKEIVSLNVDNNLLKPEDKEMLQDLIIAAINKANAEVEILSKEHIKKSTDGMMPNIPGLDLGSMF